MRRDNYVNSENNKFFISEVAADTIKTMVSTSNGIYRDLLGKASKNTLSICIITVSIINVDVVFEMPVFYDAE